MTSGNLSGDSAATSCDCQQPAFAPLSAELAPKTEACCGVAIAAADRPFEKPGYQLCHYVENFQETTAGPVPRVRADLTSKDRIGTITARLGINRDTYLIAPGLYCLGNPDENSPVCGLYDPGERGEVLPDSVTSGNH